MIDCIFKNFYNLYTESSDNSPNTPRACCYANTAECLSCGAGISVDEYCRRYPRTIGCEREGILSHIYELEVKFKIRCLN